MKPILCLLMLLVGCGETHVCDVTKTVTDTVFVGPCAENIWNRQVGFDSGNEVREYGQATLRRADTNWDDGKDVYYLGEIPSWANKRQITVVERWVVDYYTYDTICYERKECGE